MVLLFESRPKLTLFASEILLIEVDAAVCKHMHVPLLPPNISADASMLRQQHDGPLFLLSQHGESDRTRHVSTV